MNAFSLSLRRTGGLLACAGLAVAAHRLAAADPASAPDPFQAYPSYIKISGLAPSVSGNKAAYAERAQNNSDGRVGIEALHIGKDLDKTTTMEIDGHLLYGADDYLGKISFARTDVGSLEIGYKRFRTFYDGIGGFFPLNSYWSPLAQKELHTDRGTFWADLKIARPNEPTLRLTYRDEIRTGQKDSTIWGDTDFTGIPNYRDSANNPPYSPNRKLVPSYIDLDEHLKTFEAVVTHTMDKTAIELSVVWTQTDNSDTRWSNRYPGELKPYPALPKTPATQVIPPDQLNNATHGFDQQSIKSNAVTYTGKLETTVSEKFSFFAGLSYQHVSADIGADREMTLDLLTSTGKTSTVGGAAFVPNVGTKTGSVGRPPYSYRMLNGRATENILAGNFGVKLEPAKALFITLAIKGERTNADGSGDTTYFNNYVVQSTGVVTPVNIATPNMSERNETAWTPELNVRYSGVRNLTLYGVFDYRNISGDETGTSTGVGPNTPNADPAKGAIVVPAIIPSVVSSADNVGLNHGHYKVGANWNPCTFVTLRGELFYRDHRNSFTDMADSTGNFILGYQYRGVKLTGILKPLPGLTFTSRYVGQTGKMDVVVDSGTAYDSMDSRSHLFGETLDWAPTKQVYFQANYNIVFATMETAYPRAGGAANAVLRAGDNNYWNGSFIAGMAVGPTTNVELQASIYRANNYEAGIFVSTPYGAEAKESSVTLAVKQKFSDRLRGTAKVGYFESHNITTGGFTNFHGPMGYLSLEYSL